MTTRVSFPEDRRTDFINVLLTGIFGERIGVAHEITLYNFMFTDDIRIMFKQCLKSLPDKADQLKLDYPEGYGSWEEQLESKYGSSRDLKELLLDNEIDYIAILLHLEEATYQYITTVNDPNIKPKSEKYIRFTGNYLICDCEKSIHANIIFINKKTREIHRFEPQGSIDVIIDDIDEKIKSTLKEYFSSFTYISPSNYYRSKFSGPQTMAFHSKSLQTMKKRGEIIGDFCGWWCMLYLYSILINNSLYITIYTLTHMSRKSLFLLIWWFRETLLKEDYTAIKQKLKELY